jgi:hypothetical protein
MAAGAMILVILIVAGKKRGANFSPYVVALLLFFIFTLSCFAIGQPI